MDTEDIVVYKTWPIHPSVKARESAEDRSVPKRLRNSGCGERPLIEATCRVEALQENSR